MNLSDYFIFHDIKEEIDLSFLDSIFKNISKKCNISFNGKKIDVFFHNSFSQVVNDRIYIDNSIIKKHSLFSKIFGHELVHFLIFNNYGQLTGFFDEGIAVFLAEDNYYKNNFDFSIHEFCNSLLKNNSLYPLKYFFDNKRYYGRRHDFRIDIESASFLGFLIENFGLNVIYSMYLKIIKPNNNSPACNIISIIKDVFDKSFDSLELDWIFFLKNNIEYNKKCVPFILNKKFYSRIPIKGYRCQLCGCPLEIENAICDECGFNNKSKVKYY